ncbi:hypothetical protein [Ralstonia pseudosolanacearum]|uniref:hypothetical protein n=1 Tax=Ralstonia pseudosolanacearum TaxID=1310165 RepID=UPI0018D0079C|nr:hypothetical protein [Ralstonia pseudosolanacearum]
MKTTITLDTNDCRIGHAGQSSTIHAVVAWSRAARGGRQFDLLADLTEPTACSSAYGLCE